MPSDKNEIENDDLISDFVDLGSEEKDHINRILKGLKQSDLTNIKTADDYIAFVQNVEPEKPLSDDVKNMLRSEFEQQKQEANGQFDGNFYAKLLLGAVAGAATFYFAPAYGAIAARAIYPLACNLFFGGVPAWYNPAYVLFYLPGREHFAYQVGYQWGPWLASTVLAPTAYAVASGLESAAGWLGRRIFSDSNSQPQPAPKVSEEEINELAEQFVDLGIKDEEKVSAITPSLNLVHRKLEYRSKSEGDLRKFTKVEEPVDTFSALTLSR